MDFFNHHIVAFLIISVVLMCIFCTLFMMAINYYRIKKLSQFISQAPQIAANMQPGQTIVKTLKTTNDEKVSAFLAPFTADKFTINVGSRKMGGTRINYNTASQMYSRYDDTRYLTVLTITKKS
ncbi:hypothetical protein FD06_GL000725 [Apilactobacillus ozensis DSM 23829 = JCM 17196]|uniref:Uncharacterized protein n=2 Tax=Apilactobacillus ozensis TaxID=866801 RepID=A0A0R2AUX3_9LACO|nr:hypothetical protein [Apilactobacillus ozensis]KRM67574.1 hypothetical protein FD06_GL000725 [Apilactobacillus ozensis DSM 23829 = JCM 17196]